MSVKLLMLPLFLTGTLLMGCDNGPSSKSPDASTEAKAADTKAAADKTAADARATADKSVADAKAAANKDAANAEAVAAKAAADARAAADKTAAETKAAADKTAADAAREQATKLLADLQTALTAKKWSDAGALVKQLDAIRDRLSADQKASIDSLKKQYDDNKQ